MIAVPVFAAKRGFLSPGPVSKELGHWQSSCPGFALCALNIELSSLVHFLPENINSEQCLIL